MRDPNRIPAVLAALAKAWYLNPDLRLGQLVSNAAGVRGPDDPFYSVEDQERTGVYDPFHCEDDRMLRGLKQLVEK